jgi:beta-lactamase class D
MKTLLVLLLSTSAFAEECWLYNGQKQGTICSERLSPCSTFKLPLAAMAIDAKILDEKTVMRWDKTPQRLKTWEQDADARLWLKESIVWFSQRLTTQLGLARIEKYLAQYDYGNKDFSGGITKAWLESSLKISAEEQLELLKKLPSTEAGRRAIALLPVEGEVRGKTGSCLEPRLGWYIGYVKDRPFVRVFRGGDGRSYAGLEAKKWVLAHVAK